MLEELDQNGNSSAKALFEQARHEEDANGNLKAAIALYERVLKAKLDDALASQALLRMGICYQMLDDAQARKIFEQVATQHAKQPAGADAKRRLAALNGATVPATLTAHLISRSNEGPRNAVAPPFASSVSADGRLLAFDGAIAGGIAVQDTTTRQVTLPTAAQRRSADAGITNRNRQTAVIRAGHEADGMRLTGVPHSVIEQETCRASERQDWVNFLP